MNIDVYIKYLAHLLRCAVTGEQAEDIPQEIDPKTFLWFCRYHKVENIAYIALEKTDICGIPADIWKMFKEFCQQAVTIDATQQYYLDMVLEELENKGIDYLVLKGREIGCLYPSPDMRQSSDFDIYVGNENASAVKDIMLDLGFRTEAYSDDDECHDEYRIDKFVLGEIHRVLIQDEYPWKEECNKITDRLINEDAEKHCCRMSPEDFYIYNLAHTAKHMKYSGIGIRVFLDLWLIYDKYKDILDREYLNEKLELCGLAEFDKKARSLCSFWFEGCEPESETIVRMSRYVAKSGWIGTVEQAKSTAVAEAAGKTNSFRVAKLKKCYDTIFSPYESMAARYPVLKKHRWLTPLCRVHRAASAALFKRDLVKNVTEELAEGNMEAGKKILDFKEEIGL